MRDQRRGRCSEIGQAVIAISAGVVVYPGTTPCALGVLMKARMAGLAARPAATPSSCAWPQHAPRTALRRLQAIGSWPSPQPRKQDLSVGGDVGRAASDRFQRVVEAHVTCDFGKVTHSNADIVPARIGLCAGLGEDKGRRGSDVVASKRRRIDLPGDTCVPMRVRAASSVCRTDPFLAPRNTSTAFARTAWATRARSDPRALPVSRKSAFAATCCSHHAPTRLAGLGIVVRASRRRLARASQGVDFRG